MRRNNVVARGMAGSVVCLLMAGVALAQGGKAPAGKPEPDPNNAVWVLKLSGVYQDRPLTLHLASNGGKVVRAFGLGTFNKAIHDVDGSALLIGGASLKGLAKVTINADQWVPPGGKPIECRFDFDIAVKNGKLGGTYKGKRGSDDVSGMALGAIQAPAREMRGATIKMWMERALQGKPNRQRVYMTVRLAGGKVGEVKAAGGDRRHWKAKVSSQRLTVTPESLSGDVTVEVHDVKSVTAGTYTFTFDGKVIGRNVAGRFTSRLGDKEVRASAMFVGSF